MGLQKNPEFRRHALDPSTLRRLSPPKALIMSNLILGGIIGLLIGLAWCYWKQIQAVYQNRDLISSGNTLYSDAQNFWSQVTKL